MNYPTVSAICITEGRPQLLQRAIDCFHAQQYPAKELVILFPESDRATATLAEGNQSQDIKTIAVNAALTLGQKRNLAIRSSSGDFFCSWDDDDWFHPMRMVEQIACVQRSGKVACTLGYIMLFNNTTGETYLSFRRPWEGTLLCARQPFDMGLVYGNLNRGEDSFLVQALLDRDMVAIHDDPKLFVYSFHGNNVSGKDHWDINIFKHGRAFSAQANELVLQMVQNERVNTLSNQLQPFIDDLIA